MPFRKIQASEGELYHIINRGSQRLAIYFNEHSYLLFLDLLRRFSIENHVTIIALCLMPNHFHILVRVESGGNVSQFMKQVCVGFSKRMNKLHRRTGTIFEGRFKCYHVDSDGYFRECCRYIHLNPVRAALATDAGDWPYSNYQECMGRRSMIDGDHNAILLEFGGAAQYADWVREGALTNKINNQQFLSDLGDMRLI